MLINLTPHAITVCDSEGAPLRTIEPSGEVARVATSQTPAGEVDGLPIHTTAYGEATGLPDPEEGVYHLVSGLVRTALPERADLLSPGPLVRDDDGRPVGCRGLSRNGRA